MIRSLSDISTDEQSLAGGKGQTLARLYQAGFPVPDGFVILPSAFDGDDLKSDLWPQVQAQLGRLRRGDAACSLAVRSSALGEDSAQASFAGAFETVLGVDTDDAVRDAVRTVRQSRHSARVRTYSQAQGLDTTHDMAVIVQRQIPAELSGVLFTAEPVTGNRMILTGNFVHGLGESLVAGAANPQTFTIRRPRGQYTGPAELRRFAGSLRQLASRLEVELGGPQDIEWAVAEGKLFVLQSRPITTLRGHNQATGEWNDSLAGDYLWSNCNFAEAYPDVLTPCTWSLSQIWNDAGKDFQVRLPAEYDFPGAGNIGGRPYFNVSVMVAMFPILKPRTMLRMMETWIGKVPDDLDMPLVSYPLSVTLFRILPGFFRNDRARQKERQKLAQVVAENPHWCRQTQDRIGQIHTGTELIAVWRDQIEPRYRLVCRLVTASNTVDSPMRLQQDLSKLVGEADANALLSNLSGRGGQPESLGPLVGLASVARGAMSREDYLDRYGHRGPHEAEVSTPRPAEDPHWLDRQLAELARAPVDVESILAKQRAEFDAAWKRLEARDARRARAVQKRIARIAETTRAREAIRSEWVRMVGVARAFALCAGELTGLGDSVFFLSIPEILTILSGGQSPARFIPARRETYARYCALPPYPTLISGRFDPFKWAADPNRRSDLFDSHRPAAAPAPDTITGFAGAAGTVEGLARRLDRAEDGDQLQPGEILVTTMTNVGWTLLFPRAAAIVTDVGAPLSHAAIVARELGIPAVVGCGNATMRIRTGDRLRVDGGQGTVKILGTPDSVEKPVQ